MAASLNNFTQNKSKENYTLAFIMQGFSFVAEVCKYIIFHSFQKKYNLWNTV